jgi:hypothetical protein
VKFPRTRYTLYLGMCNLLMRHRTRQTATLFFFIAMTTRLFGVVLTTVTDLKTYARADVKDSLRGPSSLRMVFAGKHNLQIPTFKARSIRGKLRSLRSGSYQARAVSIQVLESLSSLHSPCTTFLSLPARKRHDRQHSLLSYR